MAPCSFYFKIKNMSRPSPRPAGLPATCFFHFIPAPSRAATCFYAIPCPVAWPRHGFLFYLVFPEGDNQLADDHFLAQLPWSGWAKGRDMFFYFIPGGAWPRHVFLFYYPAGLGPRHVFLFRDMHKIKIYMSRAWNKTKILCRHKIEFTCRGKP